MRKFIYFFIPVFVLGVFVLTMHSYSYIKKSIIGTENDISAHIESIKDNVEKSKWDEAITNTDKLDNAWAKVSKKIQFSAERDEMHSININIARLKGAVNTQDKTSALSELYEAKMHWDNIGK